MAFAVVVYRGKCQTWNLYYIVVFGMVVSRGKCQNRDTRSTGRLVVVLAFGARSFAGDPLSHTTYYVQFGHQRSLC